MTIFSLVDCNNFYASCERVFNPLLEGKPIVVLSNNDGCVIARSNEAKKLGIPMGAPFHEWRALCDKKILYAYSSNYALYGDMSNRVMTCLESFCPDIEIYSIDEAFLSLDSFKEKDLLSYLTLVRQKIKQWTGIPVSIGIGSTKTLAKMANNIAKKKATEGIFDLRDPAVCEMILSEFPIQDIWGIGRQLTKKLNNLGILTAKDLREADLKRMRMHFSVVLERIIRELRGISCLPLETVQPKKQIMSSRSFGQLITEKSDIEEALSHYTAKACVKLRKQNCLTSNINVFLHTNIFIENDPQYGNSICYHFPIPTDDSSEIISAAKKCLDKIFRKGYRYQKTGMMLLDLSPKTIRQLDLLTRSSKSGSLMKTLDVINENLGKNTLFICAEGIERKWKTKCSRRSPRYTTRWEELAKVLCL